MKKMILLSLVFTQVCSLNSFAGELAAYAKGSSDTVYNLCRMMDSDSKRECTGLVGMENLFDTGALKVCLGAAGRRFYTRANECLSIIKNKAIDPRALEMAMDHQARTFYGDALESLREGATPIADPSAVYVISDANEPTSLSACHAAIKAVTIKAVQYGAQKTSSTKNALRNTVENSTRICK